MKYIPYIFIFFIISNSLFAQKNNNDFPLNAIGIYKGDLTISNTKGQQTISMEFRLKPTNDPKKFRYVLVYNNAPRNYTLIIKDKEKGLFEIDENNGIILPAKYANNTLFSFFEVQGNFLTSRLAFNKDSINFEILFTRLKNKVKTGGVSKEIPEVFGYPISTVQTAILKKIN